MSKTIRNKSRGNIYQVGRTIRYVIKWILKIRKTDVYLQKSIASALKYEIDIVLAS